MELADCEALSFDCYGTLIDWETGIAAVLALWVAEVELPIDDEQLLTVYADHEAAAARANPRALYPEILASAFRGAGEQLRRPVSDEWAQQLANSVGDWPAFPDSATALAALAERYPLIIVSNVHRDRFFASNRQLGVDFDAVITAEDVGSYKPAPGHFTALDRVLPDLGIAPGTLLHVAQSLFHDHVPAQQAGLPSVWINRRHDRPGWGATPQPNGEFSYGWEFPSMQAFADAITGDTHR